MSSTHHWEMDGEEREEAALCFAQEFPQVMLTTSGFPAGFGFANVAAVIYAGAPYSLIDYAQETDRAGRRGPGPGSLEHCHAESVA
ncbi:hypothetical protein EHS25_000962 [Saitozyma podzolica]|uniref:Helicase C-terminal domain-containing protein n=1 Tax=Saitozyma podzolica TaxID=1890683 RepID=A0A427YXS0_9TREE|nr:hypothetical protein EHS25_000962 [Saitozyma podzolica]